MFFDFFFVVKYFFFKFYKKIFGIFLVVFEIICLKLRERIFIFDFQKFVGILLEVLLFLQSEVIKEKNEKNIFVLFEDYFISVIQSMFIVGYEIIVYGLVFIFGYLV